MSFLVSMLPKGGYAHHRERKIYFFPPNLINVESYVVWPDLISSVIHDFLSSNGSCVAMTEILRRFILGTCRLLQSFRTYEFCDCDIIYLLCVATVDWMFACVSLGTYAVLEWPRACVWDTHTGLRGLKCFLIIGFLGAVSFLIWYVFEFTWCVIQNVKHFFCFPFCEISLFIGYVKKQQN